MVNKGVLRVAISISPRAKDFGEQLYAAIEKRFGLEHTNYSSGAARGKETMIRMEAQEAPIQLFTSAWQQIMVQDFANYNKENYKR